MKLEISFAFTTIRKGKAISSAGKLSMQALSDTKLCNFFHIVLSPQGFLMALFGVSKIYNLIITAKWIILVLKVCHFLKSVITNTVKLTPQLHFYCDI